jgi:hypothetical protein
VAFDQAWVKLAAVSAARHVGVPLVSADRQLLDAGLAESPTAAASRLGLLK